MSNNTIDFSALKDEDKLKYLHTLGLFTGEFLKSCDSNLTSLNIQYELFARVIERLFIETGLISKENYLKIKTEEDQKLQEEINTN